MERVARVFVLTVFVTVGWLTPGSMQLESVQIDLAKGVVKGFSHYIHFETPPSEHSSRRCGIQSVVRIDFSHGYKIAKIQLEYDRPKLWTLDISDSPYGDGYGGDNASTSNMAEIQIFNKQMRIYGNSLPGYLDATIDGGLLLKVVDDIFQDQKVVNLEIGDEKVEWYEGGMKQFIESKFLYTLSGQNTSYGDVDYNVYIGLNRVVAGNYRNGFGLCKATITLLEEGVDECKNGKNDCHKDAYCYNTRKSFRCRCKPGYRGDGKICIDEDECEFENGGCVHQCLNTEGNYTCSCKPGFTLSRDGHDCIDTNECLVDRGGCAHQCVNTLGSYQCRCNAGYSLTSDGRTCTSTWCQKLGCDHHCRDSGRGQVVCACREGYRLHSNGKQCTATCEVGNGGCQHKCEDGQQEPSCSCHDKYILGADEKTCIASCSVNNGGCDRRCRDSPTGPTCSCPPGYQLHQDEKTCLDEDECMGDNGGCSHGCVNTHGSFECICPKGFKVQADQRTCEDVDECDTRDTCDHTCVNTAGAFYCVCHPGYQMYGQTHCADTDECSVNNGGCAHICENAPGSFWCLCRAGYRLHANGRDCVEAVECPQLEHAAKTELNCSRSGQEMVCHVGCERNAHRTRESDMYTTRCSRSTGYMWTHEMENYTLPACSENIGIPTLRRRARFQFPAPHCAMKRRSRQDFQQHLRHDLTTILADRKRLRCPELCDVGDVDVQCEGPQGEDGGGRVSGRGGSRGRTRRYKWRAQHPPTRSGGQPPATTVQAKFELQIKPQKITDKCGIECGRTRSEKRLKKSLKTLRKKIKKEEFYVRLDGQAYSVEKKSLKTSGLEDRCDLGQILVDKICVACSLGTFYNEETETCQPCAPGTYQNSEGQISCKLCPHHQMGVGLQGAISTEDCEAECEPGSYSVTGRKPCSPCSRGTYQPGYGRITCISCGTNINTASTAATSFKDCNVKQRCRPGYYYERSSQQCRSCPLDTYQTEEGQDFCIHCPGNTTTDQVGSFNASSCKDRRCGGYIGQFQGVLQSPNWPGEYPGDVECTWNIAPDKGRRILVVIPEIFLNSQDRCGDVLVMRKRPSPYSTTTYETCESTETPIAFTARSRRLWVQFRTTARNHAKGFSISYVTYNEEYQELIEDIVRDGRLYSSQQHQEVLKNRKLLSALLEVIAQPYNYFKYANISHNMFPESFIRLLTPKVRRFFT